MRWTNAADFHLDDNTQRALLYRVTGGYLARSILDLIGPSANESNVLSQVVPEEFRSAGQEDAAAAAARKAGNVCGNRSNRGVSRTDDKSERSQDGRSVSVDVEAHDGMESHRRR
jgi:hypothetical protein